uniref:Uncharacterized protein n=1 Tax=Salix viminalis TaxID=40686 RepID=A0A6N2KJ94_SALVM
MPYMTSLTDAKIDVWRVRANLRATEARSTELERDLTTEKERLSLEQAIERVFFLQQLPHQKNTEFGEMQHLLHVKEPELVEDKLDLSSRRLNSGRELKSDRNRNEELKIVLERMETKEKELKNLKEAAVEDANDLRKLYSLAQERIGERNIGNLAIKKLKLERASVTKFLKRINKRLLI